MGTANYRRQGMTQGRHRAGVALCRLRADRPARILLGITAAAPRPLPMEDTSMRDRHGRLALTLAPIALGLALVTATERLDGHGMPSIPEWSAPVNLGPDVNSASEDLAPHLSSDGLALYFASTRPGSVGGEDLWVARRASRHEPFGPAANVAALNTAANERSPALSRNRRLLFFATDRPGGSGSFDIWVSWRPDPADDFGWQAPVNLGTGINSAAVDAGPSFLEHGDPWLLRPVIPQLYLASSRPGGAGGLDLYVGSVPGGWAGPPALVSELNSAQNDLTPTVRRDGLEIVFATARTGVLGGFDLWQAFRKSVRDPWSAPTSLGPQINTDANEVFPSLSFDAETLVFQSNRTGGFGGSDLYVSTR
jgi:WD40 repeat protein